MRQALFGMLLALPLSLTFSPASALPAGAVDTGLHARHLSDVIEVKRGGRGHGWGRGGGHRAHGWSRGRKVGWRGRGCPPGLAKQGRC